jgi:protein-tyrosine-phosphatase
MVKKQGLERSFRIDSAATSREEIGNPCYPPARRKLAKEGLSGEGHAARKMVREDYENYDYLIGMDDENLYDMYAICEGNDPYSGGWRRRDFSRERTDIQIPRIYDSVKRILNAYNLPCEEIDYKPYLLETLKDKKNLAGTINFILIDEIGHSVIYSLQ